MRRRKITRHARDPLTVEIDGETMNFMVVTPYFDTTVMDKSNLNQETAGPKSLEYLNGQRVTDSALLKKVDAATK